jgi:glycosyltransferase involved in cell wall biosynthesis
MTEKHPLVSIIILTMNHEKFIEQACNSAISQTYPNLEIILLDNFSNDETFQKAKNTLENSKVEFQIFRNNESFGVAKNLNFLVSKCHGDWVAILSGDDWWAENMIAEKINFVQKNSFDIVLSDGYKYLQQSAELVEAYTGKDKDKVVQMLPNFFHENVTENRTVNVGTFVKKKILEQQPFDEEIQTEDWDMNLRLTHLGYKIGFLDQKLFYYRVLNSSLSRNWVVMADSYKKVTAKYLDYILSDKDLAKNYYLNLLKFHYESLLSKNENETEKKKFLKEWKKEKYKLKYSQPLLFFKLLLLKMI